MLAHVHSTGRCCSVSIHARSINSRAHCVTPHSTMSLRMTCLFRYNAELRKAQSLKAVLVGELCEAAYNLLEATAPLTYRQQQSMRIYTCLRRIRGCARDRQRSQHHLQLLMETDNIARVLAQDPLMCHYEVVAKDTLPEVVSTYPSAFVCNTHDSDQPGEHWVAMYVDEIGDYFDPYGQKPYIYCLW